MCASLVLWIHYTDSFSAGTYILVEDTDNKQVNKDVFLS